MKVTGKLNLPATFIFFYYPKIIGKEGFVYVQDFHKSFKKLS